MPGRRGRLLSLAAAALLNGGAAATRFGVFEAGMVTARDPAYTVQPQRARVEARRGGVPVGMSDPMHPNDPHDGLQPHALEPERDEDVDAAEDDGNGGPARNPGGDATGADPRQLDKG